MVLCLTVSPTNYDISFVEGEIQFFGPQERKNFIQSEAIAESERSEAKQGEARYKILKRVGAKKLNFPRLN